MLDPAKNPHFSNRISDGYNRYSLGYGVQAPRKIELNYWNNMEEIGAERKLMGDEDSGVCSPPLWRTSPARSPQHRQNHYRSLSPSSRAQAIARGQRELMEMVSRMPEGCYELSLKDIVEHGIVDQEKEKEKEKEREKGKQESFSKERNVSINSEEKKRHDKKVQMNRSASTHNSGGGFLLKMVFPVSLGSRRKKKKNNSGTVNNSVRDGRVSPKPLLFDGSAKSSVDNEWWKNRFAETGENDSAGFSSNSGSSKSSGSRSSSSTSSSRNSSGRRRKGGCWSFIFRKREYKAE
ncbi:hypothetical protein JCGZ_25276 [Jatropha curcas]|uniref:Uncharacterized protein n=1 Tax=Jatropha curcas TaxID=180498 RepID=A0A067LEZ8_JATCU|nr:hypothetical protein JCGZ_25276 [Jatropha curcas]